MYAMGILLLEKDDLSGAVKMAEEGLSKYPQSLPVQILSLNTITVLLDKNRLQDAERLISKYPGSSPDLVFQQGALAFLKKTTPWRRNFPGSGPPRFGNNGGKRPVQ